jgi:hypothetical protein
LTLCAAAIFVVLVGVVFWIERENRELRSEIASREQNARPIAGGVYSASLISSGLRGGSAVPSVVLPNDARILQLDLELGEAERRARYSATLFLAGRRVWQEEPLRPDTRAQALLVSMWIPADVLAPGNYTLALESGGNPVFYYSLKIVR